MTEADKTWISARDNYLQEVKEALKAAGYPGPRSIIEEVRQHLESRYSELTAESRTSETYQQIMTEMGPASDYADLLGIGMLKRRVSLWKKIAVTVPVVLIALAIAWDRGIIGTYSGPRTYVIPESVGARWGQPFTPDPELAGNWKTVDFVHNTYQFIPGRTGHHELYLISAIFRADGSIVASMRNRAPNLPLGNWTKGWIIERFAEVQAQYAIKQIDGKNYLFLPWLSGDVSRRYKPPSYYVLKKADN